ncbi:hypothetical protein [Virgibacillus sediminis]|uniref:Uncharacterized protein n=1 Tax=Virgibacillus sediminis TaxID=202260 RepID=A0ABV7A623_9BACI
MSKKAKKQSRSTRQSNRAASLYLKQKSEVDKMPKLGTKKTVEIEGIEYTLQHPGTRAYAQIQDRIQLGGGKVSSEKMSEELFKHVVVEPKVSFEYFDEHDGYEEVVEEAMTFLRSGK